MFEVYGKAENDPGEWFPMEDWAKDGEPVPALRVRHLPSNVARTLEKKYGKDRLKVVDGMTLPDRSVDESLAIARQRALWAWTDTRNVTAKIKDAEGAELFQKLLSDPNIKAGDDVPLDGRLSEDVKLHFLEKDLDLVGQINAKAFEVGQKRRGREEDLSKT
jgi:hypothetical protein